MRCCCCAQGLLFLLLSVFSRHVYARTLLEVPLNGDYNYLYDGRISPFELKSKAVVVIVGGMASVIATDLRNTLETALPTHAPSCMQSVDFEGISRGPRPLQVEHHLQYDLTAYDQGSSFEKAVNDVITRRKGGVVSTQEMETVIDGNLRARTDRDGNSAWRTIFVLNTGPKGAQYSYSLQGSRSGRTDRWIAGRGYLVIDLQACNNDGMLQRTDTYGGPRAAYCGGEPHRWQDEAFSGISVEQWLSFKPLPSTRAARSKIDGHMYVNVMKS